MFNQVRMRKKFVALRIEEKKEEKVGSFFVTSKSTSVTKETPIGEVVSIGDEVEYVAVGNKVLISPNAGIDLLVGGEKLIILEEQEILALLEE